MSCLRRLKRVAIFVALHSALNLNLALVPLVFVAHEYHKVSVHLTESERRLELTIASATSSIVSTGRSEPSSDSLLLSSRLLEFQFSASHFDLGSCGPVSAYGAGAVSDLYYWLVRCLQSPVIAKQPSLPAFGSYFGS